MNNFTKKGIVQKIIVVLIFLIVFNFCSPFIPRSNANVLDTAGGILTTPTMTLLTALCDGVMALLNGTIISGEVWESTQHILIEEEGENWLINLGVEVYNKVTGFIGIGIVTAPAQLIIQHFADPGAFPTNFWMPIYIVSPEAIFANTIPGFDVNFIEPKTEYEGYVVSDPRSEDDDREGAGGSYGENGDSVENLPEVISPAVELQSTISNWYVSVRNMVLVAYMCILVYVGIRIVISATASDKAKYKESLQAWGMGLLLVVCMHYIMIIGLELTDLVTSSLISQNESISMVFPKDIGIALGLEEQIGDEDYFEYGVNFTEYARIMTQMNEDPAGNPISSSAKIGYLIILIALVIYTIMFAIMYFKRIIYMAFLTVIAPVVAMTYPIDKLRDGRAQGFDMWIKEYMFNLLLQPLHLALYTVLIGSAMQLASSNMLYALVALGFVLQSDKLMRKFFGFQNNETGGKILGGAAGGAMAMGLVNASRSLLTKGGKGSSGKGSSTKLSGSDSGSGGRNTLRTADISTDELLTNAFPTNGSNKNNPPIISDNAKKKEIADTMGIKQNSSKVLKGNLDNSKYNLTDDQKNRIQELRKQLSNSTTGKKRKIRSVMTGLGNKYTGKAIKGVARASMIGAGALTLGTIGVAAGLVSDDYSNVFKYGAAGLGVGGALGGIAGNKAINAAESLSSGGTPSIIRNIKDDYLEEKYKYDKEGLEKARNEQADKEFKQNKEIRALYQQNFGKEGYKQAMEDAIEYRSAGVTSDEHIIGAMKLQKNVKDTNKTSSERIAMAKMATNSKSQKDLDSFEKALTGRGVSKEEAKRIMQGVAEINDM